MKKGYILTLGTFIVLAVVLSLAISISTFREKELDRLSSIAYTDRVFELSSSVEKGFREILSALASFEVKIEEGDKINISITDNLTRDSYLWGNDLGQVISYYKTFIESQDQNIVLSEEEFDELEPLYIYPYDITYTREWGQGLNTISVIPQDITIFDGFEVIVNSMDIAITRVFANPIGSPGEFSLVVKAYDNFGFFYQEEFLVDPETRTDIEVKFFRGNKDNIVLEDNILEVSTNQEEVTTIETRIIGLPIWEQRPRIIYAPTMYNVTFSQLGINKEGGIQFM